MWLIGCILKLKEVKCHSSDKTCLLIDATTFSADPIPSIVAQFFFTKASSFLRNSCTCFALAFTKLKPSTAWSHSSGDASIFLCFETFSSVSSSSSSVVRYFAVAVEEFLVKWDINLTPLNETPCPLRTSREAYLGSNLSKCFSHSFVEKSKIMFHFWQFSPSLTLSAFWKRWSEGNCESDPNIDHSAKLRMWVSSEEQCENPQREKGSLFNYWRTFFVTISWRNYICLKAICR